MNVFGDGYFDMTKVKMLLCINCFIIDINCFEFVFASVRLIINITIQ